MYMCTHFVMFVVVVDNKFDIICYNIAKCAVFAFR